MLAKIVSVLGLLCGIALLVQLLPASTNNLNLYGLRIASTVLTWAVTLVVVLVLGADSKLLPVALHIVWGVACMVVSIELVPSALPIRIALGLAPLLVNLAGLLPSQPLVLAALACQSLSAVALLVYAPITAMNIEIGRDQERQTQREAEAKVYDEELKKELDALDANSPVTVFIQLTHRASDSARDQIAASALAKKPNLEAELVHSLTDPHLRWRAYNLIASPLIPRTPALVNAVRDSISLTAAAITPNSSDDEKDGAAYTAVTIAEALPAHKTALRPAMVQLRTATGDPVKRPGSVTGREELARWLR
jgi:hypothetical protein